MNAVSALKARPKHVNLCIGHPRQAMEAEPAASTWTIHSACFLGASSHHISVSFVVDSSVVVAALNGGIETATCMSSAPILLALHIANISRHPHT